MWAVIILDLIIFLGISAWIGLAALGKFFLGFVLAAFIWPFLAIKVFDMSMGYMKDQMLPRFPIWKAIGIVSIPLIFLIAITKYPYPFSLGIAACIATQTALFQYGQDILSHLEAQRKSASRIIDTTLKKRAR